LRRRVGGSVDARITQVKLGKGTGRGGEGGTSQHVQPLVGQEGGAQTNSHGKRPSRISMISDGQMVSASVRPPSMSSVMLSSHSRRIAASFCAALTTSTSAVTSRPYRNSIRTP